MNYARLALASLGATVAYFVFGFIMFAALPAMKSEFMKYPDVYRSREGMMKVMPYSIVAILVSIVVVAVLYAKNYPIGGGIASGLYLGALIGIFSVCTYAIHNYVNLNIGLAPNDLRGHHLLHPMGGGRRGHRLHLQAIVDLSANMEKRGFGKLPESGRPSGNN